MISTDQCESPAGMEKSVDQPLFQEPATPPLISDQAPVASPLTDSSKNEHAVLLSVLGPQFKFINDHVTFLTHQVVQLMQVLCISHCRCQVCLNFMATAKLPQVRTCNNLITVLRLIKYV